MLVQVSLQATQRLQKFLKDFSMSHDLLFMDIKEGGGNVSEMYMEAV